MSDEQSPPILEIKLADKLDRLRFSSPEELQKWNDEEFNEWQWVNSGGSPFTEPISQKHQQFRNQIRERVQEWQQRLRNPQQVADVHRGITALFEQYYGQNEIFNRTRPATAFITKVRAEKGEAAAAGAYTFLLGGTTRSSNFPSPRFFEGLIDGLLFTREIDWTATAHQEALSRLKAKYDDNIAVQDKRAEEIEKRNQALNSDFGNALSERREKLETLHSSQTDEFKGVISKHEANLKSIEETYDQKLALQKPVAYWETKERYHSKVTKYLALAASVSALVAGLGMASLIHWIFVGLQPGQDPRHWQIGILITAAFFTIWFLRILIRLFFSNHHLATDAAERRTMILTYLAMAREGADAAPDDKKLILQHIFRSASDGLVKDDAAPPSFLEFLTRGK